MDNDQAREVLYALLAVPGALRIVTSTPAKNASKYPVTSSRHFVVCDVVAIEEVPSRPLQLCAVAAEGHRTWGQPAALLHVLQKWQRA